MENRCLTDPERTCIRWALREADVADDDLIAAALDDIRLFKFRPTLRHVSDPLTLVALLALRTRASGITLGRRVYLRADQLDDQLRCSLELVAHETAHVLQFIRDGAPQFLAKYLGSYLWGLLTGSSERDAYLEIPYEREARKVARLALERHAELTHSSPSEDVSFLDNAR